MKQILNAIVQPRFLDQTTQDALIKSLYPAGNIPIDAIYIVLGSLGHGALKASIPTQQRLIRWLVMTYDFLEDSAVLSKSYNVLFNLLDSLSLRADLCCLLAKVTRKKNVKPWRLELLQDLVRKVGQEPALLKLMRIYDRFAPGLLDFGGSKKGTNMFKHPDSNWGSRLEQIQSVARLRIENSHLQQNESHSPDQSIRSSSLGHVSRRSRFVKDVIVSLSEPLPQEPVLPDLQEKSVHYRAALEPEDATLAAIDEMLSSTLQQYLKKVKEDRMQEKSLSSVLDKALIFTRNSKVLSIWNCVLSELY